MRMRYSILLFLLLIVHYCVYASGIPTTCITKKEEIHKALPHFTLEEICTLFVVRQGNEANSHMMAKGLNGVLRDGNTYRLTLDGFKEVSAMGELIRETESIEPPKFIEVKGRWSNKKVQDGVEANILGANGSFILEQKGTKLEIPLVVADNESLAYYNARLIQVNDVVKFNLSGDDFPITVMDVGDNYVDEYLMKIGGGFYVEYHNEPHFHMPLNKEASGFYLLGKRIGERRYRFTAFKIPFGTGVYTNKNTVHCDAGLTGDYLVGYTIAREYSTVLLRSSKMEKVKVVAEKI